MIAPSISRKASMSNADRHDSAQFENEVRRIARALWPGAEFDGAAIVQKRERDGVFVTEDCIHVVEATTSRRKEKAKDDLLKISRLLRKWQTGSGDRAVRGWFVTRDEPTADQRDVAKKYKSGVNTLSFSQFQARLIDSKEYLSIRDNYAFGSVRDPATGQPKLDIDYVPLDLVRIDSSETISRNNFISLVFEGRTVILLGDYGAGKSMTLRELYFDLRKKHFRNATSLFPVYLNLRDHYGQTEPAEVIERHARWIGFPQPSHLVRAWRAGYVHLLIDGFDEISTINIQGLWRKLKENRYRAMEAVRRLIRDHPSDTGLVIAGRAHFFDTPIERRNSLGLPSNAVEISLNEFTEDQITTYLKRAGLSGFVPPWLPSRPLLVGYLAAKDLLRDTFDRNLVDPATGWNILLNRIADREAEIEAGIDGSTIRRILERLATKTRASQGGVGSLNIGSITEAFNEVCGYNPDERGMILLQRLPGLGVDREDENSRIFIDEDFADACKAGDLVNFINSPFDFASSILIDMESEIGGLGIGIASLRVKHKKFSEGKINAALLETQRRDAKYMAIDIVKLLVEIDFGVREEIILSGLLISHLEINVSNGNFSKLRFHDCFFSRVELGSGTNSDEIPSFRECYIDEFEGRISKRDLPIEKFDEKCVIEKFTETAETTNKVLALDLPLGTRVCITILKKLYEQSGSGRRENALHRGLDHRARRLVSDVLQVLQSEGLAVPDRTREMTIWRPDRGSRARVGQIISAPTTIDDPIIRKCDNLSSK